MKYATVCSGIEACSAAWHPLGWQPQFFSEIEPFPSAVLAHHYPTVPNLGDMTKFKEWPEYELDLICGGTPCQSFSVAGLRKGLDDPRGNLMLTFGAIADRYRPTWLVWENVPGVLSSNGGRDFGTFLGMLGKLGYGFAYRVLDAQFFGVAQRRRRVFVVGCVGDWRRAAAVLFERHSLSGHPAPSRKTGQEVAGTFTARAKSGGWGQDPNLAAGWYMQPVAPTIAGTSNGGGANGPGRDVDSVESLICMSSGQANAEIQKNVGTTLTTLHEAPIVAGAIAYSMMPMNSGKDFKARVTDVAQPVMAAGQTHGNQGGDVIVQPVAIQNATRGKDQNGLGIAQPGDPMFTLDQGSQHAVVFAQNQRDEVRMMDVAEALAEKPGMKQQTYVAQTLYNKGINQGDNNAGPQKTDAKKILLRVRQEIGAQAFAQWGLGILDSLRTAKILRPEVHGEKFRQAPFSRSWVVCCSLGSPLTCSEGAMQSLREALGSGCPPQGWGSLEQCADELGAYLSQLSQPRTQAEKFMHDLWQADEGAGLLREALSEIQAVGRSDAGEGKPAHQVMQVRRLTVLECEFLQGFPRNYTLITVRNKPAADGPRYKALGNSMAVPCMLWIGKRIQMVEDLEC